MGGGEEALPERSAGPRLTRQGAEDPRQRPQVVGDARVHLVMAGSDPGRRVACDVSGGLGRGRCSLHDRGPEQAVAIEPEREVAECPRASVHRPQTCRVFGREATCL